MADTDHLLCVNKIRSDSRSSPLTARTRMCVSRLSICLPLDAGGKDIASNPDLVPHTTNQLGTFLIVGNNPGNWLSVFGNDQSVDIQLIQQCQALFFEFRCSNPFHIIGAQKGQAFVFSIFRKMPQRAEREGLATPPLEAPGLTPRTSGSPAFAALSAQTLSSGSNPSPTNYEGCYCLWRRGRDWLRLHWRLRGSRPEPLVRLRSLRSRLKPSSPVRTPPSRAPKDIRKCGGEGGIDYASFRGSGADAPNLRFACVRCALSSNPLLGFEPLPLGLLRIFESVAEREGFEPSVPL